MNVLILGAGEVGSHLARILARENHDVTVVDVDPVRAGDVRERLDVRLLHGDASDPDVLKGAGVEDADLLVAVTSDDRANLLACLFGKLLGAKRAVVRVHGPDALRGHKALYRRAVRFDAVVSLEQIAADEVLRLVRDVQAVEVESFAGGRVQLRRLKIPPGSRWAGVPMRDLRLPRGVLVAAILSESEVSVPGGDDVIGAGDQVIVVGQPSDLDEFERKSGVEGGEIRSVVILAGSGIGVAVARGLVHVPDATAKLLEEDLARAETLALTLRHVEVLHGDGTDVQFLREVGVGSAGAFVAVTNEDARNLLACQLAKSLGARKTIALVHKPDYVLIYDLLGIDAAVSPRLLCANHILRFARGAAVSSVASIEEGKAEVLELDVERDAPASGRALADVGFPRGVVVGAIVRDGEVLVPRGEDLVRAGDTVVVFALAGVVREVERFFRRRREA